MLIVSNILLALSTDVLKRERKDKDKKNPSLGQHGVCESGGGGWGKQGSVKAKNSLFSIHNFNYVSSSSGMLIKKLEENSLIPEKLFLFNSTHKWKKQTWKRRHSTKFPLYFENGTVHLSVVSLNVTGQVCI